jgi:hypothetical protein
LYTDDSGCGDDDGDDNGRDDDSNKMMVVSTTKTPQLNITSIQPQLQLKQLPSITYR